MTQTLDDILGSGGAKMRGYLDRPLVLTAVDTVDNEYGPSLELTFIVESGEQETVSTGGKVLRKQALALKDNGLLPAQVKIRERLSKKTGNTYYELVKP